MSDPIYSYTVTTGKIRDYFAGLALQGIVSNSDNSMLSHKNFAETAYQLADAMLKEREKKDE